MTLNLQDPAFLAAASGASNIIDILATSASANANVFGNFRYIRKSTLASATANLLNYVSVGRFNFTESGLPIIEFYSATSAFFHPGNASASTGVRWTSPLAGTVYVSGAFNKTQVGSSDGVRVAVYKNNTTAVVSPVTINTAPASMSFTRTAVAVAVGDTLDFLVDRNANNNFDNTSCSLLRIELS